jgi:signal transduction histidine kinase
MENNISLDLNDEKYIAVIEAIINGERPPDLPVNDKESSRLSASLVSLSKELERRARLQRLLDQVSLNINAGMTLESTLERVYSEFKGLIPYNRIGVALIDESKRIVKSIWSKSDQGEIHLQEGFAAPLAGSSLQAIIQTGEARILNDLVDYLDNKPESNSTRLIVEEGMRASLTCPLIVEGKPLGFIFFTSVELNAYSETHIEIFQKIAGQLAIVLDKGRLISELEAQKARIERKNEELQRLNELKNIFLGIAAHDLRSPISYIHTTVDLMLGPESQLYVEHTEAFLQNIRRNTIRLLALISDLLDLSEIEAGELKIEMRSMDLWQLIYEVVQVHSHRADENNIRIICPEVTGAHVYADPARMNQVLDNLLSNAIKFSPSGGEILIEVINVDRKWRVSIQDQGPGVAPIDQERIFQPYSRLLNTPGGGARGVGLGLAISKWIMEAHGGEIGIVSQLGEGSMFWFSLPEG